MILPLLDWSQLAIAFGRRLYQVNILRGTPRWGSGSLRVKPYEQNDAWLGNTEAVPISQ